VASGAGAGGLGGDGGVGVEEEGAGSTMDIDPQTPIAPKRNRDPDSPDRTIFSEERSAEPSSTKKVKLNKGKDKEQPTPTGITSTTRSGRIRPTKASDASSSVLKAAGQSQQPLQASDASSSVRTAAGQLQQPLQASDASSSVRTAAGQLQQPLQASDASLSVRTAAGQLPQPPQAADASSSVRTAAGQLPQPPQAADAPSSVRSTADLSKMHHLLFDTEHINKFRASAQDFNREFINDIARYNGSMVSLLKPSKKIQPNQADAMLDGVITEANNTFRAIKSLAKTWNKTLPAAGQMIRDLYREAAALQAAAAEKDSQEVIRSSGALAKLRLDLESSKRSASTWNERAIGLEKELAEAKDNTDGKIKSMEEARDQAIRDHAFSEGRRLEIQRKYDSLSLQSKEFEGRAIEAESSVAGLSARVSELSEEKKELEVSLAAAQLDLVRLRDLEAKGLLGQSEPVTEGQSVTEGATTTASEPLPTTSEQVPSLVEGAPPFSPTS
jgi:hypothetical protein